MGSKERRARERSELRERILDAAREMFVSEGFDSVTMRSLAQRIEYSPTAIYLHFKDKESLLAELCQNDLSEMHEALHRVVGSLSPLEGFLQVAKEFVRFALQHQAQYQLVFMTKRPGSSGEGKPHQVTEIEREAYAASRANWQRAIEAGLFRDDVKDADMLAQIWFCGLHGIVATKIGMGLCEFDDWRDPEQQAEAFSEALLRGLVKDPSQLDAKRSKKGLKIVSAAKTRGKS